MRLLPPNFPTQEGNECDITNVVFDMTKSWNFNGLSYSLYVDTFRNNYCTRKLVNRQSTPIECGNWTSVTLFLNKKLFNIYFFKKYLKFI